MKVQVRTVAASLALSLSAPVPALAQRGAFVDAIVEFHSALFGTYGDEGPQVTAALDRMAASLDSWERSRAQAEAALRQRATTTPAEWALLHAENQQLDAAIASMKEAIAAEPRRASLHVYLGRLHDAVGQAADAAAAFNTARALDPADPIAAYLAGLQVTAEAGDSQGAADALRAAVMTLVEAADRPGQRSRMPVPHFALIEDLSADARVFAPPAYENGFTLLTRGRFREAIESFRASAARDPLVTDPAARTDRVMRGIAALRARQGNAAIEALEAAVRDSPGSSEARRILGIVYRAAGRLPQSITQFEEAIRLAPQDERARVALGSTLMEAGRLQDAERVLRETIQRLPTSGEARWALAEVHERSEKGAEAIRVLDEAAALIVVAGKAHLYWRLAQLAHGYQRDHARVIDVLTRRVRLVPNEPHAHKDLGLAYSRAGRDDEALLELLMATMLGLQDAEMLTAIGQIHLDEGRLDRAEAALVRAVALDPATIHARYALGRTLQRLGRRAEAAEQLAAFERLRAAAFEEQKKTFDREVTGTAPSR